MSRRAWPLAGAAIALLLCCASCAVLTQPELSSKPNEQMLNLPPFHVITRTNPAVPGTLQEFDDGYTDRTGVIHVHTRCSEQIGCGGPPRYSHDAHGTFEDVVRVANAQQLEYVITTEHNNLNALRDGLQGWHGGVLVLVGMELSTRSGHYVTMNVTQEVDRFAPVQQVIDEVNRQGGFGFIAHPFFKKARWTDWTVSGFTGVEAYNVAHDTLDENKLRLVLWTLTSPVEPFYFSILDRPYDPLSTWDRLIGLHGKVVGIGATDAHEYHALGLRIAPYEVMFRLIRTHLLTPEGELTDAMVYDALRKGHAYLSIELVAPAKGFQFAVTDGARVLGVMGDDLPFQPGLVLTAALPSPAQLTLFKDGSPVAGTIAQTWNVPVESPGAYRLEASRHDKPWIFSNPIYIRPALDLPSG